MTKTIFIIDDDQETRKKYKKRLVAEGFRVIEAPDALEVVNILMREKSRIELILLDINMPEVDGREIFEIIEEYAPHLEIIVASLFPIGEQKLKIPKAVDYFNKSQGEDVLLTKIRKLLGLEEVKK